MKRKSTIWFRSIQLTCILLLACLCFMSCAKDIHNIMTYSMKSLDDRGAVVHNDKGAFTVYRNFSIQPFITGNNQSYCTIRNNADSTMIIDLGESYYIYNSQAQRIYSNRITTTYNSGTIGGGVNVGAITNAVGIGGVVGEIANGVNIGGSKTKGKAVQEIEERFISIPPHSYRNIPVFFTPLSKYSFKKKKGVYTFSENQSSSHEYLFSYTFDPKATSFSISRSKLWLSQIESFRQNYYYPLTESNQYSSMKERNNTAMWALIGGIGGGVGLGLLCK